MLSSEQWLLMLVLLPLGGFALNGLFGHRLPRSFVGFIACGTMAVSLLSAIMLVSTAPESGFHATYFQWIAAGTLKLDVALQLDRLSGLMCLVITGVGFLIHVYSLGYMAHEPAYARYFAYLNLFSFAMLVLVLADSLPLMFVGWEGVGLCSYLLIGFWYADTDKAAAGRKAFIVNRIGDFGFLVGMLILFRAVHALTFSELQSAAAQGLLSTTAVTGACLMLFLGATGKSAQLPLYVWLPDAMAGPTPVSALIHAATMVTAGVYLIARLGFLFVLSPIAMVVVAVTGALTALFAATMGTAQNDIKKVLAYSTVSQLGFMFIAAGVGAYAVAIFHVVTHAFFKACLFLGSGSVIHGMSGEQDMRQMGGLLRKQPITAATFIVATLAITGFPFLSGFISKDAILWSAFSAGHGEFSQAFSGIAIWLWLAGVIAAGFTSFYMWRLVFLTFFGNGLRARSLVAAHVHESGWSMTMPLIVLALLSVVGGALGWPHVFGGHDFISAYLSPAVRVTTASGETHVALELLLMGASVGVSILGFALAYVFFAKGLHPYPARFAAERPFAWLYRRVHGKWHVDELYEHIVLKPVEWVSRVVLYEFFDKRLIDGSVHFVGWAGKSIGLLPQLLHTGNIQRYLAVFSIGVAVMLYVWMA